MLRWIGRRLRYWDSNGEEVCDVCNYYTWTVCTECAGNGCPICNDYGGFYCNCQYN